jgi:hypothetical protein
MLFTVAYLYWICQFIYICEVYIILFWWGIVLFLVCLTVKENVGMPKTKQKILWFVNTKKKEGNLLAERYSLRNLNIIYKISKSIFYLRIPTLDR